MSYHVNASSSDGATSVHALTLEQAQAKAADFKAKGHTGIVIMDAGTGLPVRGQAAKITANDTVAETSASSPADSNIVVSETDDLIVALQTNVIDEQSPTSREKPDM